MTGAPDRPECAAITGLASEVQDRIIAELGENGEQVLRCLLTADSLLNGGHSREQFPHLAETAAYNLRQALDSVVLGAEAATGGLPAIREAWQQYKDSRHTSAGEDEQFACAQLEAILDRELEGYDRKGYRTRQLLALLLDRSGVPPIPGDGDPTARYQRIRDDASRYLHGSCTDEEAGRLFADTISWFTRFFTPPSARLTELTKLAQLPYAPEHLATLADLALDLHHLRIFLERVEDPAWLSPMYAGRLIRLAQPGELWPVSALAGTSSRMDKSSVAGLLGRLLADVRSRPVDDRLALSWEIMRAASWLGQAGHEVVIEALKRYPEDHYFQTIALGACNKADVGDPIHLEVCDLVIGNGSDRDHEYTTKTLLERLVAGMSAGNVEDRFQLIATKVRRLMTEERARYLALDIAALTVEGVDWIHPVLGIAEQLALSVPRARALGMSSRAMLRHVRPIRGELGERLVCQVLAGASDVDRGSKMAHLEARLASETATGDDRALIDDLAPFTDAEIDRLRTVFGRPDPPPGEDECPFGPNWPRAWRWSLVLSPSVLIEWIDAIAAVTTQHGAPNPAPLDTHEDDSAVMWGSSPFTAEELAALDVVEAAAKIAAWRPDPHGRWGVSARELGRTLEAVVKDDPEKWTADPVAFVRMLREPVYIEHYLRGVVEKAAQLVPQADGLLQAVELASSQPWEPTRLGRNDFDYTPDWSVVETVAIKLVDALADENADIEEDLAMCWMLAIRLLRDLPEDRGSIDRYVEASDHDTPYGTLINRPYGSGLLAVLSLGGWEHRNRGGASARFFETLTEVLAVDGAVGLELRSGIASRRPFLEAIAANWLREHQDVLFGDALGAITFDQTLKWSRPTPTFYGHAFDRLVAAARRGADNALGFLLIAYLWDVPGYSFERIVDRLAGSDEALTEVGSELARLVGTLDPDQVDHFQRGVDAWGMMLDQAGRDVPLSALGGLGRWAHVDALSQQSWLALTERTVVLTSGAIDMITEVAGRCRDVQPDAAGLRILIELLGRGDSWEQHYVESIGVEALRMAAEAELDDESIQRLRDDLIHRGRADAV